MLASYGFVAELLHPSEFNSIQIYPNALALVFNLLVQTGIVKSGNDLTEEAEMTSLLVSKIMNEFEHSESQKINFIFFMTQAKTRQINVQNQMFAINWQLLLAVS